MINLSSLTPLQQYYYKKLDTPKKWRQLAIEQFSVGNYEEANSAIKKYRQYDQNNYLGRLLQGKINLALGNWPEAKEGFEKLINEYGQTPELLVNIAKAQFGSAIKPQNMNTALEAFDLFEKAIKKEPTRKETWMEYLYILTLVKWEQRIQEVASRALEQFPQDPEILELFDIKLPQAQEKVAPTTFYDPRALMI